MKKNWGLVLVSILLIINFLFDYGPQIVRSVVDIDQDDNGDVDTAYGGTNVSALNGIQAILTGRVGITEDSDGDTYTTSDPEVYGYLVVSSGDNVTFTLPELTGASTTGLNVCFLADGADGTAHLNIDVNANDHIEYDGTSLGNGVDIDNNGTNDEKGNFICLVAIDDTTWTAFGRQGVWD